MADRSVAARFLAHVVNPALRMLLRSPAHRMMSGSVLILEYTGRHSGRGYALPVMYASVGDGFVVMAGNPADKTWWRNFGRDPQPVMVTVSGKRQPCTARLLDVGADEHRQETEAYQRRFPKMVLDPPVPVLLITRAQDPGDALARYDAETEQPGRQRTYRSGAGNPRADEDGTPDANRSGAPPTV